MRSRCDKCGEAVESIDAGFSPGLHEMRHDCGGTWREVPAVYSLVPPGTRDLYAAGYDGNRFDSRDDALAAIPDLRACSAEYDHDWEVILREPNEL